MAVVKGREFVSPLGDIRAASPEPRPRAPESEDDAVTPLTKAARDSIVAGQLAKTKMCAFYERGKCASANCKFAHSADELRTQPNLQKTKLCRNFLAGSCLLGENCMYAHGEGDLRVTQGIYKTQMCNFYERGYCKKGDRCSHAHGQQDIHRPLSSPTSDSTPLKTVAKTSLGEEGSALQRRPRGDKLPLAELLADATNSLACGLPTPIKSTTVAPVPDFTLGYPQGGDKLPLAELLADAASTTYGLPFAVPTPTKSDTIAPVSDFTSLGYTPGYSVSGLQMQSPLPYVGMWPQEAIDPIDLLVERRPPEMSPDSMPYFSARRDSSMALAFTPTPQVWSTPQAGTTPSWFRSQREPENTDPILPVVALFSTPASSTSQRGGGGRRRRQKPSPSDVEGSVPTDDAESSREPVWVHATRATEDPLPVVDLAASLARLDCAVRAFSDEVAEVRGRIPRNESADLPAKTNVGAMVDNGADSPKFPLHKI